MRKNFLSQTQSIVLTIFGDYVYMPKLDKPLWIGSLISLLAEFGFSEQATRLVISRMLKSGLLVRKRNGVNSFYSLSNLGLELMQNSEDRIFPPVEKRTWHNQWFMVFLSIPEYLKEKRDRIRRKLKWLGFGTLSNNVWVSPYNLESKVCAITEKLGVTDFVELFSSIHLGYSHYKEMVSNCWDLQKAHQAYSDFLDKYSPRLAEIKLKLEQSQLQDNYCFMERVTLVNDYRKFPFLDPGLPEELMHPGWLGGQAVDLFNEMYQLLGPRAIRFFNQVTHSSNLGKAPGVEP